MVNCLFLSFQNSSFLWAWNKVKLDDFVMSSDYIIYHQNCLFFIIVQYLWKKIYHRKLITIVCNVANFWLNQHKKLILVSFFCNLIRFGVSVIMWCTIVHCNIDWYFFEKLFLWWEKLTLVHCYRDWYLFEKTFSSEKSYQVKFYIC